jgi:hypothetical protein
VPNGGERKFTAFISYKHADNSEEGRRWAAWLHEQIEAYRVPRDLIEKEKKRGRDLPRLLYPVFRDPPQAISEKLWETIKLRCRPAHHSRENDVPHPDPKPKRQTYDADDEVGTLDCTVPTSTSAPE